jgi:ABC-2 type transport system permease protein
MEKEFGLSSVWHLARNANSTYFSERSVASGKEPPVYMVDGQGYISYGKSHTVMMALKDLIGEDKINQVLKTLIERHSSESTSSLTSLELLNEVYKVTPVRYHTLVTDWFKRVIVYDLAATGPSVEKLTEGRYQITFNLKAKRFESQNDGSQKALGIREPISIGVFTQHPGSLKKDHKALYLKPSQITQENSIIRIIVNAKPAYLAIDPFGTRSDKNLEDNLIEL